LPIDITKLGKISKAGKKIENITSIKKAVPKNIEVQEVDPSTIDMSIFKSVRKVEPAGPPQVNLREAQGRDVTDAVNTEGSTFYLDIDDAKRLFNKELGDPEKVFKEEPERVRKLQEDIGREGLRSPIEIEVSAMDEVEIADGHHRITALEQLGETRVPIKVDEDFVSSGLYQRLQDRLKQ